MRVFDRLRRAFSTTNKGLELPEARENRGRFVLNLGPFNLNRRNRKVDQLQAYQNWVAASVNTIARDVRHSRHNLGTITGPNERDFDPFDGETPEILRLPTRNQTIGHQLELSVKHLDLAGECFWYLVTEGGRPGGPVVAIQVIQPNFITEPVYSEAERRFVAWRFNNGVAELNIPFEDMIWTRYPHPLEDWRGASPVEQVALSYDMDLYAKAYGTQVLEGGGLPPGILSLDGEITPEQAAALRQRWKNQRREDPEAIAVVGKGARFERTGATMQDLEFLDMSRMNRDQVLAIYGVPAAKLGLVEDVNRANSDSVNREYARNTLKPRLALLEESINTFLLPRIPEIPGDVIWRFEDPVQPDREYHLKRANEGFEKGLITVDEYRTETGRDPLDGDGDVYKRVGTFRDTIEAEEPPAPPMQQTPGARNPDDPNDPGDDEDPERQARALICNAISQQLFDRMISGQLDNILSPKPEEKPKGQAIEGLLKHIDPTIHSTDDIIKAARSRGLIPIDLPMSQRQLDDGSERFLRQQGGLEREMRAELRKLWANEKAAVVKRVRALKNPPKIETRTIVGVPTDGDWFEQLENHDAGFGESHIWREHSAQLVDGLIDGSEVQRDMLDVIFNRQERSWLSMYRNFLMRGYERGWDLLRRDTGRPLLEFDRVRPELEMRAQRDAERKLAGIQQTSRRRVGAVVAAGIAAGISIAKIADAIARLYDTFRGSRSGVVARTETAGSINLGRDFHQQQATEVLGARIRNTWTTVEDERVRGSHASTHNQVRFLGTPFNVGGEPLDHPHDPDGSAGNVINCRCTLVSEIVEADQE